MPDGCIIPDSTNSEVPLDSNGDRQQLCYAKGNPVSNAHIKILVCVAIALAVLVILALVVYWVNYKRKWRVSRKQNEEGGGGAERRAEEGNATVYEREDRLYGKLGVAPQ